MASLPTMGTTQKINPLIVSAPFGNYYKLLRFTNVTHTLGTFTATARGRNDLPYGSKWGRVFRTVRYSPSLGSWINQIGLKNPGIEWCEAQAQAGKLAVADKIISILGWDQTEWHRLINACFRISPAAVEFNASCPNVTKPPIQADVFELAMDMLHGSGIIPIVKLPPVFYQETVATAYAAGIRHFHACNTLPTPRGGVGGKALLKISQGVVSQLRRQYDDIFIIGGGGITTQQDVLDYFGVGANRVALGSMLFFPWNWHKVSGLSEIAARTIQALEALA